jgi:hypothetical protein
VCPQGTRWHQRNCAQECAQTGSDPRPSAPNGNQACTQKQAGNRRFQACSRVPGGVSKPPPSATRPPHRRPASIRDKGTCVETLDSECVEASAFKASPLTLSATARVLSFVGLILVLGTSFGHTFGHTRRVFHSVRSENGRKTSQGDGSLDRRLGCSRNQSPLRLRSSTSSRVPRC